MCYKLPFSAQAFDNIKLVINTSTIYQLAHWLLGCCPSVSTNTFCSTEANGFCSGCMHIWSILNFRQILVDDAIVSERSLRILVAVIFFAQIWQVFFKGTHYFFKPCCSLIFFFDYVEVLFHLHFDFVFIENC